MQVINISIKSEAGQTNILDKVRVYNRLLYIYPEFRGGCTSIRTRLNAIISFGLLYNRV